MFCKYALLLEKIDEFDLFSTAEKVYGPYFNSGKEGRQIVIVINDDGTRRTVSYPKHIMEKHLGRILDKDESTVDHLDFNFMNNDLTNLRLVPRAEHSADDTRRVKLIKLKCSLCGKEFERSPRLLRDKAKKGRVGPFCGRTCSGRYARMLQLKQVKKFDVQKAVDSEYYRRKNVQALALYFTAKYAV